MPHAAMPLVTVKPRFQVTLPAKLRKGLDLCEGDIMEATVVGGAILFRPKGTVDRGKAADRVAEIIERIEQSPEDALRSEEEVMAAAIAEIAEVRRKRRNSGA